MLKPLLSLKEGHKTILIATGTKYSSDVVLSALALYSALKHNGRDVHILGSKLLSSKVWQYKLSTRDISINGQPPSRYTFKLPPGFVLKDISWEKEADQVLIKMDAQAFEKKIPPLKVDSSPLQPDLIVYLGTVSGLNSLEKELPSLKDKNIEKLILLPKKVTYDGQEITIEGIGENKSFSYKVFKILKELEMEINLKVATFLYAGLISHTDLFMKNINPELLGLAKDLLEIGADHREAYDLGNRDKNLKKIKFLSELNRSATMIAPGVYQAGLILNRNLKMRLDVAELMQISQIFNCELAIVSISTPIGNRTYIRNHSNKYDLKKVLSAMKGKGNANQGVIESKGDISQIHTQIYEGLGIFADNAVEGGIQAGT